MVVVHRPGSWLGWTARLHHKKGSTGRVDQALPTLRGQSTLKADNVLVSSLASRAAELCSALTHQKYAHQVPAAQQCQHKPTTTRGCIFTQSQLHCLPGSTVSQLCPSSSPSSYSCLRKNAKSQQSGRSERLMHCECSTIDSVLGHASPTQQCKAATMLVKSR